MWFHKGRRGITPARGLASRHDGGAPSEGTVVCDPAQRIVAPFFIGLTERRHSELDAMEEITPTARRQFSFPSPVDVHSERGDQQDEKENDERQAALQSTKL